ncbi:MAG: GNAT family N-acetyltransferase [Streptosporangiaceae bacterium]
MLDVRPLAAGDIPAAVAIVRGLPDYFTDDVPASVERDAVSHDAWVLTDSGAVAGFAVAARKSPRGAEILWIAVEATRRRRGHGTLLLGHVLDQLAAAGVSVVAAVLRLSSLRGDPRILGVQRLRPCGYHRPAAGLAARQPRGHLRSRDPRDPMTYTLGSEPTTVAARSSSLVAVATRPPAVIAAAVSAA